jgi:transposase
VEPGPALATAPGRTRPARPPAPSTGHLGRPTLVALPGVGIETAGQLLVTAGDNPQRRRSEAAFAHLCGTAPIPASSARTDRHRLNRGGDRRANNALWRITLVRMRCHPPTKAHVQRRTNQGPSKLDITRCLKRYIAREIYHQLTSPPPINPPACLK